MKKKIYILVYFFSLICLLACEKVIDIDLNSSSPQIVIEGEISDQPSSCFVKLSQTVNFDEPNVFPAISGAIVQISDDEGNSGLLLESPAGSGLYYLDTFRGQPERTYTLQISHNNETYEAVSRMPKATGIDTLTFESSIWGKEYMVVKARFQDFPGIDNYYRLIWEVSPTVKETNKGEIYITNDYLQDGQTFSEEFYNDFKYGDSITLSLQNIDRGAYEYLRTINEIVYGGGEAPTNPLSNFSNGALGFFNAYSVSTKFIVWEK